MEAGVDQVVNQAAVLVVLVVGAAVEPLLVRFATQRVRTRRILP